MLDMAFTLTGKKFINYNLSTKNDSFHLIEILKRKSKFHEFILNFGCLEK